MMIDRMMQLGGMSVIVMVSIGASANPTTHRPAWHPAQAAYRAVADIPSHHGRFRATLSFDPTSRGGAFSGEILLTTSTGVPVDGADLILESGMPDEHTVATTRPVVTADLGDGRYRVTGMRFDRTGHWNVRMQVRTVAAGDSLAFNIVR